jgi:hypothetical protein
MVAMLQQTMGRQASQVQAQLLLLLLLLGS